MIIEKNKTNVPNKTSVPIKNFKIDRHKKIIIGQVVKTLPKTLIVNVSSKKRHKLYKKVIIINKKFYVHDEKEEAKIGDIVEIFSGRPMSRLKRFWLYNVKVSNSIPNVNLKFDKYQNWNKSKNKINIKKKKVNSNNAPKMNNKIIDKKPILKKIKLINKKESISKMNTKNIGAKTPSSVKNNNSEESLAISKKTPKINKKVHLNPDPKNKNKKPLEKK